MARKTIHENCDILVVGGGMAGTGAAFEARHWGRDLKIICVEKANIDRSGAVAQGLVVIGETKSFSVPFLNLIFQEIVPFSSSLLTLTLWPIGAKSAYPRTSIA